MVFPHRECGFAAVAAPIPVYGSDCFKGLQTLRRMAVDGNKVMAGGTPANPATLVLKVQVDYQRK
jgi:hypothetical protein